MAERKLKEGGEKVAWSVKEAESTLKSKIES
jgi:hypothetical protein